LTISSTAANAVNRKTPVHILHQADRKHNLFFNL